MHRPGEGPAAICAPENPQLIARLVAPAAGPARDLLLSDIVRMARSADGLEVVGFPTVSQPSESEVQQPPPAALPRGEFIAGLQGHFISAQGSRISIAKLPERDAFVWENKENLIKWELVPEKAGDDNIFATSGLNVMSTCPFYADGHVLLMLEWKGKSVSKLHGPGGEVFEPDKTRAGDKPHSPAIEHLSDVLKFQLALGVMKSRQPFPTWLVERAKNEEEKRAVEAEKAAKVKAEMAAQVASMCEDFSIKGTSKYNAEYYCNAAITFAKGKTPDMCTVEVCYEVHGDGSLGPLQDPASSSLLVNGNKPTLAKASKTEESPTQIKGTLEYEANISIGSRVDFTFGTGGYSSFGARCAVKVMKNDEGHQVSFGEDSFAGYIGSDKYYCGQRREIPGSNGQCGPTCGPQCASCLRYQNAHSGDAVQILQQNMNAVASSNDDQAAGMSNSEPPFDSGPSLEDWALAADNAHWSQQMDKVLADAIAESVQASAQTNERLKVGMKVRLTANYESVPGEARSGPLRPGDVGTLMEDDRSRNPYRVVLNDNSHWYEEGTIEEAVDPVVSTLQLPSPKSEPALAGMSAKTVAARAAILLEVAAVLRKGIKTLNFKDTMKPGSMANTLWANRCARDLVERTISDLFIAGLNDVKRQRAREFPSFQVNRGILPADQRKRGDTVFSQTYEKVGKLPDKYPLLTAASKGVGAMFWEVKFDGEGGIDYGGLFRDSLREICAELQCQGTLQLLVPCANNKYAVALNQDKWILNPARSSGRDLAEYAFVGRILGASIHTKSSIELDLAPHVWKQLLGQAPTLEDILSIDQRFKASWVTATSAETPEAWEALEREWRVYDWCRGGMTDLPGESGRVSFQDRARFLEMWKAFRLSDEQLAAPQAHAMGQGFLSNIPSELAPFMRWEDVQHRSCGSPEIPAADLKVGKMMTPPPSAL